MSILSCAITRTSSIFAAEVDSDRSRFLLLDSRIIENTENAKLSIGTVQKHGSNPLFGEDKPWEKRFDNLYGNVIYDEEDKLYKCWYSPFIVDHSAKGMELEARKAKPYRPPKEREMAICYATSKDGITWDKPELGMVQYDHSKKNNILWRGERESGEHWQGPHGSGIFKDLHDPDPSRRYKAVLKGDILSVAFSADGLRWSKAIACPTADVAGDTHNNAFWAPTLGKYVGITREWGVYGTKKAMEDRRSSDAQASGRQVARIESKDFINWSKAEVVLEGMSQDLQTYAMPVFFHAGVYLGLLAIHQQSVDRVWTELTWSPDTKTWHRISPGTPLIPNSEQELDYDYGCVYACATPVFLEDEIRLYYGGSDWLHFGWRNGYLCLATLRPDGFAGYEQKTTDEPAVLTTKAVAYQAESIRISADVGTGGWVKTDIMNSAGKRIARAETVSKTVSDERLILSNGIESGDIQIRFVFKNARIYSFSLVD